MNTYSVDNCQLFHVVLAVQIEEYAYRIGKLAKTEESQFTTAL